ncbi:MAG TPA: flagellar filament capping protein FliD [Polyangiales bacterium]|nr:flagellar filament capping protein FliD [Polyangiales bacterium]
MASPITFSGLASGIDSASLIDALVKSAQTPITNLQADQKANSSQSTKITDIKTKLSTLQTAAQGLDTKTEALGNKSSTSNDKALTVTAAGGAAMGTYKVEVKSLAAAERTYSNKVTASDQPGLFGAGMLKMQVGSGEEVELTISETDTLASVAKKINASGAQVSAGVFSDGAGGFRLQVTGTQAGEKNGITFTELDGLSLGLSDPLNEKQKASDALVSVDGMDVKSATNSVSGAVPGVTLNLVDVGTSTVKVDRDEDGMKTKLQTSLRGMVGKLVPNGDSSMQMLSAIGVSTNRDGTLTLDDAKYSKAVAKDYEGVASMLTGRTDGTGLMKQISDGLLGYTKTGGTLSIKLDNLTKRNKLIDSQISTMQTRIDKYKENLQKQFTALEETMSNLNSQGSSLSSILASA